MTTTEGDSPTGPSNTQNDSGVDNNNSGMASGRNQGAGGMRRDLLGGKEGPNSHNIIRPSSVSRQNGGQPSDPQPSERRGGAAQSSSSTPVPPRRQVSLLSTTGPPPNDTNIIPSSNNNYNDYPNVPMIQNMNSVGGFSPTASPRRSIPIPPPRDVRRPLQMDQPHHLGASGTGGGGGGTGGGAGNPGHGGSDGKQLQLQLQHQHHPHEEPNRAPESQQQHYLQDDPDRAVTESHQQQFSQIMNDADEEDTAFDGTPYSDNGGHDTDFEMIDLTASGGERGGGGGKGGMMGFIGLGGKDKHPPSEPGRTGNTSKGLYSKSLQPENPPGSTSLESPREVTPVEEIMLASLRAFAFELIGNGIKAETLNPQSGRECDEEEELRRQELNSLLTGTSRHLLEVISANLPPATPQNVPSTKLEKAYQILKKEHRTLESNYSKLERNHQSLYEEASAEIGMLTRKSGYFENKFKEIELQHHRVQEELQKSEYQKISAQKDLAALRALGTKEDAGDTVSVVEGLQKINSAIDDICFTISEKLDGNALMELNMSGFGDFFKTLEAGIEGLEGLKVMGTYCSGLREEALGGSTFQSFLTHSFQIILVQLLYYLALEPFKPFVDTTNDTIGFLSDLDKRVKKGETQERSARWRAITFENLPVKGGASAQYETIVEHFLRKSMGIFNQLLEHAGKLEKIPKQDTEIISKACKDVLDSVRDDAIKLVASLFKWQTRIRTLFLSDDFQAFLPVSTCLEENIFNSKQMKLHEDGHDIKTRKKIATGEIKLTWIGPLGFGLKSRKNVTDSSGKLTRVGEINHPPTVLGENWLKEIKG